MAPIRPKQDPLDIILALFCNLGMLTCILCLALGAGFSVFQAIGIAIGMHTLNAFGLYFNSDKVIEVLQEIRRKDGR